MFRKYLKHSYHVYFLYLIFIIFTIFMLEICHVVVDLVVYMLICYLVIILIFFIIDYKRFYNNYKILSNLKLNIRFDNQLPAPIYLNEDIYQNNLIKLQKEYINTINDYNLKQQNMLSYYTRWVHQIKTPIAGLKLLIQNHYPDSKMLLELVKIEQYVEMVLQYIRLDNLNHDLSFKEVSLDQLLLESIKKYSLFFIEKDLKIDYQINDYKILTDPKWSAFVIEQVLSNALKYTKTGSITFYNDKDKLFIKDSGIGINSHDLPRVFEQGYTGGRNDKKATGLGLYLSKNIFDKLGHSISITSTIDVGTTVCLDFHKNITFIE